MRRLGEAFGRAVGGSWRTAVVLAGVGVLLYGLHLVSQPATFIAAGAIAIGFGLRQRADERES